MILIIVTFPKISMNPLYVTSRYLFPSFCWFIICVQQSFQLGISISNSQTIGKIYLVIIKSIWILIKCIDWSLEDGISHEKIQLRRIFYRTIISESANAFWSGLRRTGQAVLWPAWVKANIFIQDLLVIPFVGSKTFHEEFEFFPFGFGPPLSRFVS